MSCATDDGEDRYIAILFTIIVIGSQPQEADVFLQLKQLYR